MTHPIEKLQPRPPIPFTEDRKLAYIEEVRRTGFIGLSAEAIGVSDWTIRHHRKEDPEFSARVEEALRNHAEDNYIRAMIERGVVGTLEPIVGGKDRDEIVAHKRNYSDTCLMALAKMRLPEMRDPDGAAGSGSGFNGGVLIVPAAPSTMDDWERDFGEAAKGQTGREEHA